jgi:hypothetical protein
MVSRWSPIYQTGRGRISENNRLQHRSPLIFSLPHTINSSRDNVIGIAIGYGLNDRRVRVRVPVGSRIFASSIVQTGFGVHPTSYTMGTGGSFPRGKEAWA